MKVICNQNCTHTDRINEEPIVYQAGIEYNVDDDLGVLLLAFGAEYFSHPGKPIPAPSVEEPKTIEPTPIPQVFLDDSVASSTTEKKK